MKNRSYSSKNGGPGSTSARSHVQSQGGITRSLNYKWLIICSVCITAFLCVVGIANAAQPGGGSSQWTQKQQNIQRLFNTDHAHAAPKTGIKAPTAQAAPALHAGIADMHQGPFSHSLFTVRNFWQGPVGANWVLAYVGAKTTPDGSAGQGGMVLYTETVNAFGGFDLHPLGTFQAPDGTTALTVTAVNGDMMTLRSDTGKTLTFNLQTHLYQ